MRNRHYPRKLDSQLREWQRRIERLRQRLNESSEASRPELENQIEDLRAKQQAARDKLEQLAQRPGLGTRLRQTAKRLGEALGRSGSGP